MVCLEYCGVGRIEKSEDGLKALSKVLRLKKNNAYKRRTRIISSYGICGGQYKVVK